MNIYIHTYKYIITYKFFIWLSLVYIPPTITLQTPSFWYTLCFCLLYDPHDKEF